jgi:hypothetical protein
VCGSEDVRRDDLVQQSLELPICEVDVVERLELLADVFFQRGAVSDVLPVFILQPDKLLDKLIFQLAFWRSHHVLQD